MNEKDYGQEYMHHAHRMQAGVEYEMNQPGNESTTPKHLRVGINTAMQDQASLVKLLIGKGIITQDEYLQAIAEGMKEEADAYERRLQEKLGPGVKLGSMY
jgi:hypothetical protein